MLKSMGIYKITNLSNGKYYIGSSNNLKKRKREHLSALLMNKHDNSHLQNAFNVYGEENFEFEIVEIITDENNLKSVEQSYIDKYNVCNRSIGYNINMYASGGGLIGENNPNYGKLMSEEQKNKIRKTMVGVKYSSDRCNNMSIARKGKCVGADNYNYNREVTTERRKHQSDIMKGRFIGENNLFYNKKHSNETKSKMREKKLGQTGEKCPNSIKIVQLTKEGKLIEVYPAMQEAQRQTGVWASNIQKCCVGQLKTSGGYKWMYIKDYQALTK